MYPVFVSIHFDVYIYIIKCCYIISFQKLALHLVPDMVFHCFLKQLKHLFCLTNMYISTFKDKELITDMKSCFHTHPPPPPQSIAAKSFFSNTFARLDRLQRWTFLHLSKRCIQGFPSTCYKVL